MTTSKKLIMWHETIDKPMTMRIFKIKILPELRTLTYILQRDVTVTLFQTFISEVFLNKSVIVYLDNVLKHWSSMQEHVAHVLRSHLAGYRLNHMWELRNVNTNHRNLEYICLQNDRLVGLYLLQDFIQTWFKEH